MSRESVTVPEHTTERLTTESGWVFWRVRTGCIRVQRGDMTAYLEADEAQELAEFIRDTDPLMTDRRSRLRAESLASEGPGSEPEYTLDTVEERARMMHDKDGWFIGGLDHKWDTCNDEHKGRYIRYVERVDRESRTQAAL